VPLVLGSRSTALGAGFGGLDGRALRAGDRLAAAEDRMIAHAHWPGVPAPDPVAPHRPLRVLPGPHGAELGPEVFDAFLATAWTVSTTSDRVGLRLDGDPVPDPPPAELASHGVIAGTIQLPPDRRPIVLLVDHQPTGGYPVIGVVITADLDRLGQLAPGAAVSFERTTPEEARAAIEAQDDSFADALAQLRDAARWDDLWRGAGA
jgi:allophanate hydrolase subunit 2